MGEAGVEGQFAPPGMLHVAEKGPLAASSSQGFRKASLSGSTGEFKNRTSMSTGLTSLHTLPWEKTGGQRVKTFSVGGP